MEGYILLLEDNKYYVGISGNLTERLHNHFNNDGITNGSSWTRKYKPIKVIEYFIGTKEKEKIKTLEYMKMYGWENVRGAGWTALKIVCPICLRTGATQAPNT